MINLKEITFGSSSPERLWNSLRGIIKAAKLAVYKARKTTANSAQILDINLRIEGIFTTLFKKKGCYDADLAVKPLGQSTLTEA